jgi:hypothetical protein
VLAGVESVKRLIEPVGVSSAQFVDDVAAASIKIA